MNFRTKLNTALTLLPRPILETGFDTDIGAAIDEYIDHYNNQASRIVPHLLDDIIVHYRPQLETHTTTLREAGPATAEVARLVDRLLNTINPHQYGGLDKNATISRLNQTIAAANRTVHITNIAKSLCPKTDPSHTPLQQLHTTLTEIYEYLKTILGYTHDLLH